MNFIQFESAQKLRGGFYTDAATAAFLVTWAAAGKPTRILEPSCGDGCFLAEVERAGLATVQKIVACELNPAEAGKARERTSLPLEVKTTDFLRWFLFHGQEEQPFDAA